MLRATLIALTLMFAGGAAHAEVTSSAAGGFIVRQVVSVPADHAVAYRKFLQIDQWWDRDHTFSGDAANLSIKARPGGCWCETLKDGGFVRHMDVVYAAPGEVIRFTGGLGPLQQMAVAGAMSVTFEADGPSTKVTMTYAVGGYAPNGLGALAPIVDGVLGGQMLRYREFAGRRR